MNHRSISSAEAISLYRLAACDRLIDATDEDIVDIKAVILAKTDMAATSVLWRQQWFPTHDVCELMAMRMRRLFERLLREQKHAT